MTGNLIRRSGEIVGVTEGVLLLEVPRAGGCASCRQKSGCAQGALSSGGITRVSLPAATMADASPGAAVAITLPGSVLGRLILLAYLLVPVLMLTGAWLASLIYPGDAAAFAGAIAGCGLGCVLLRLYHSTRLVAGCLRSLSVGPGTGRF